MLRCWQNSKTRVRLILSVDVKTPDNLPGHYQSCRQILARTRSEKKVFSFYGQHSRFTKKQQLSANNLVWLYAIKKHWILYLSEMFADRKSVFLSQNCLHIRASCNIEAAETRLIKKKQMVAALACFQPGSATSWPCLCTAPSAWIHPGGVFLHPTLLLPGKGLWCNNRPLA